MLAKALPKVTMPLPGPKSKALIERREKCSPGAIRCAYPVVIKRGEGAMIEDQDGNVFLDWIGGVGVLNIGYSHKEVVEAVKDQADKYFHSMMNISTHEGYIELAEKLGRISPLKGDGNNKVMFANSGAEAVENAVKIAKAYTGRPNIIVFTGAFHGRTFMTMTMTAKKSLALGMGPFPECVYRAPYPYMYRGPKGYTDEGKIDYFIQGLEDVFDYASPAKYTAAIVLEPVQGEGGFVPAPIEWVKRVRKICDDNGILLIADEVQTGYGRSGKMFVSDYWKEAGAEPDVITMAKSMGGGIPISAVAARTEIFDSVPVGIIGGTYGGNALAVAAGLKILEVMERDNLCARSRDIAEKCVKVFQTWKEKYEVVGDVRGIGCMMGIEFVKDKVSREPNAGLVNAIVKTAYENGLLIENAGVYGNVIRFLCPLVVTDEQLDAGLKIYEDAIKANI